MLKAKQILIRERNGGQELVPERGSGIGTSGTAVSSLGVSAGGGMANRSFSAEAGLQTAHNRPASQRQERDGAKVEDEA